MYINAFLLQCFSQSKWWPYFQSEQLYCLFFQRFYFVNLKSNVSLQFEFGGQWEMDFKIV